MLASPELIPPDASTTVPWVGLGGARKRRESDKKRGKNVRSPTGGGGEGVAQNRARFGLVPRIWTNVGDLGCPPKGLD